MKSQVLDDTHCWSKDNGTKSQQRHGSDDIVGERVCERESDSGQVVLNWITLVTHVMV